MYPSKERSYSGLFVKNQVDALVPTLPEGWTLEFIYMRRRFTGRLGSLFKYLVFGLRVLALAWNRPVFDIVHIHYYMPTVYIGLIYKFLRSWKTSLLVTFHGGDIDFFDRPHWFYRMPARFVSMGIGVSAGLTSKIETMHLLPSSKIRILSAGISNEFEPKTREKNIDILFVGSLLKYKGIDRLINVLRQIEKPLKVSVVGVGPELTSLQIFSRETHHRVSLAGSIESGRLPDFYSSARFLLNTSRLESFGLVIAEAMACGCLPIATLTDGSKEQIVHGRNGFLVEGQEEEELCRNLAKTIDEALILPEEKRLNLSSAAIDCAQKYKLSNVANELVTIYSLHGRCH